MLGAARARVEGLRLRFGATRPGRIVELTIEGYRVDRASTHAAAIGYRVLFGIFPLILGLAAIGAFVLRDVAARESIVSSVTGNLPGEGTLQATVERLVAQASAGATTAGLIAIPGLIWAASGMMAAIRNAVDAALGAGVGARSYVLSKLVDLTFVLGVGVLLIASFLLTVVTSKANDLQARASGWPDAARAVVDAIATSAAPLFAALLSFAVFVAVYRVLPARRVRGLPLLVGAGAATLGFELLKRGFAIYATSFANFTSVYGALGTVIAFLVFVYIAAIILMVGAELAAAVRDTAPGARPASKTVAGPAPPAQEAAPAPPARPGALGALATAFLAVALWRRDRGGRPRRSSRDGS